MPPIQFSRDTDRGFAGVALTFARVPMALTPGDLAGADVAVLGAPFDLAVTYRPGTRFGPRAVRQAEDVGVDRRPSIELGLDPYAELSVVDYGDAAAPASDVLAAHASIQERVAEILSAGALPVVIGGDHS
ncbi:MAG: arginase family protein, partial [Actinomycetota bacterium]|nr:arginase family protein [Actinomycetota bacterium]